jgi:error-prone DNA polymerase
MSITLIGLDTAKSVIQLHAVNESGKVEIRRKLQRSELIPFFEKQEARMIAPEAVRPFVKKGKKNDAADAAALCAAASRPDVKFVPAKTLEQQGVLALHSVRSLHEPNNCLAEIGGRNDRSRPVAGRKP